MHFRLIMFFVATLLGLVGTAIPDTVSLDHGGDTFISGSVVREDVGPGGDTFMAARTAVAQGASQGDLHVVGFDVSITADGQEDLYALGNSVVVKGKVAKDMTVMGMSVRTEKTAVTAGNVRLFGNTLTIDGPVSGALIATAQDVILNAPIGGDVRLSAKTISFGPDAVIGGTLTYVSKEKMTVPERVAPPARVVFEKHSGSTAWEGLEQFRQDMPVLPTFASLLSGFLISLLFFVVLGALMLGLMPKRLETLRQIIVRTPGQSLLLGVIGLSVLFGLVPITGLTIVGLPFVPIVMLAIIVAWTLGYGLAAYSVAMRVWSGLGGDEAPSTIARLSIFAAAIICIALLNFIPFVGWVVNYTLVLLGIGAITNRLLQSVIASPGIAFDVDMKPIRNDHNQGARS